MKNTGDIKPILLADYRQPSFWARSVSLTFDLNANATKVTSRVFYEHNPGHSKNLELQGKDLKLIKVRVAGKDLELDSIHYSSEHLLLENLPDRFELEIETLINPKINTALEGLYMSNGAFFTQCEAQGFRRMTYFLDRPDVMATFETTIMGDKSDFPVMLSNGNLVETRDLADGRHMVRWQDPFPKPSYLFALVAGKLGKRSDTFVTKSGRKVSLEIFVEPENLSKCDFAFSAVKQSMKWDEEVYGLEYDLDVFMIVAVNDFNMGAMENKGLNIFNAKYVLASPETATDRDFENILGIVGHEYFHNWSGNRVTVRDWFQLSLKEGLTVFRDQMFSSDMGSAAVKRIQDVKRLRDQQFPEDAGPMSHPVRPTSYIEINNFYTATVYEKGAEIVHMLHTLLGEKSYKTAMTQYFQEFDGKAVTIEDMLRLIEKSSKRDLSQFMRWYEQPGTPTLRVHRTPNSTGVLLKFTQELPNKSGFHEPKALLVPVRLAFIGKDGSRLESVYQGQRKHEHLIELTQLEEEFRFEDIPSDAIPSLLRFFSAPVKLQHAFSEKERMTLLASETDLFNKYEAAQQLAESMLGQRLTEDYTQAFKTMLSKATDDPYFTALAIQAPTADQISQNHAQIDLDQIYGQCRDYRKALASSCQIEFEKIYQNFANKNPGDMSSKAAANRELRNTALSYLSSLDNDAVDARIEHHYHSAKTMTDSIAAIQLIASRNSPLRSKMLEDFYQKWKNDPLVLDKWFAAQAASDHPDVLSHVQALVKHEDFDLYTPNRVFSVFRQFARLNPYGFHHISGAGYELVADYVLELDHSNPQTASRLANVLTHFHSLDMQRQNLIKKALRKISEHGPLSSDVYEIVSKSLA